MRSRDIIFSIIFLILTYYIVTNRNFLSFKDPSDLFYYILFYLGALIMAITSITDLHCLKEKSIKNRISLLFCFISSLIFIFASAYSIFANWIETRV